MAWPVRSTRTVYENRWITVDEERVTTPAGDEGLYGVVTLNHDAVFVVGVTDDDEVLFVDLDRHTVGRSLEVVAGGTDGEDARSAAERELLEETGYVAREWTLLGSMDALNGVCRAREHVYLARGLTRVSDDPRERDAEGIAEVMTLPITEVIARVRSGAITDSETLGALLLALVALDRV